MHVKKNKTNLNHNSVQILTAFLHLLNWQTCVSCVVPGFLASKVPENLDAVVIGSGIGGLGVAVLLAKVGKKVLVLEQHDRAGGCCHTFSEKGYEFDVGPADSPLSFLACPGVPRPSPTSPLSLA